MTRLRRTCGVLAITAATAVLLSPADAAPHRPTAAVPSAVDWRPCPQDATYECGRLAVPRDYGNPSAGTFDLALARLPAADPDRRIGTLFVNFGGPGGTGVLTLVSNGTRLFADLHERFDIVTFDPRGVGASTPAIDCQVDQEQAGPFGQPFEDPDDLDPAELVRQDREYLERCERLNHDVLPYVSTANVARDMEQFRQALGEDQLSYLGLSYGSFLGATYASLFPDSYRGLVLEGPVDPIQYAQDPIGMTMSTARAMDRATDRFLRYCAQHQADCSGFGDDHPRQALDRLVRRLDEQPLPVGDRFLDGDDVEIALGGGLRSRDTWDDLAAALAAARDGNGQALRSLADGFYGRLPDGTYRPSLDAFFAVSAADQRNPTGLRPYLRAGRVAAQEYDHSAYLTGYTQHLWGADRTRVRGVYRGPFTLSPDGPAALVVGTTYDPASPYEGAVATTRALGNARLLTLVGDGHGAYGGESGCIDEAVDHYLLTGELPAVGTRCRPNP